MSLSDTIRLIIAASDKIDVLWQLFIQVHIAVFALIFIKSKKFDETPRVWVRLSFIAYAIFLGLNFISLFGAYENLTNLHLQLAQHVSEPSHIAFLPTHDLLHPALKATWVNADFSSRKYLLMAIHGYAFVTIFAALFLKKT